MGGWERPLLMLPASTTQRGTTLEGCLPLGGDRAIQALGSERREQVMGAGGRGRTDQRTARVTRVSSKQAREQQIVGGDTDSDGD